MITVRHRSEHFRVHQFVDKDGVEVRTVRDATVVIAICTRGTMRGIALPFSRKMVGSRAKIGDEFIQHTQVYPKRKR